MSNNRIRIPMIPALIKTLLFDQMSVVIAVGTVSMLVYGFKLNTCFFSDPFPPEGRAAGVDKKVIEIIANRITVSRNTYIYRYQEHNSHKSDQVTNNMHWHIGPAGLFK